MPPAVVGRGPQGPDIDDPEKRGIIPRIVEHIFQKIRSAPQYVEFTVLVSYMEIYCERINDLLDRTWDAPYAAASPRHDVPDTRFISEKRGQPLATVST